MNEHETGQVSANAAEVYEQFFVPALFQEWPTRILDAAGVQRGDSVLDVACGTGVLARQAWERVAPTGSVVGLDVNDMMLDVARAKSPDVEWRSGTAESLPFTDQSFDHVVSQFGLMFFQDQVAALREMIRVTRPGGSVGVAVWASLDETPGYAAVAELLDEQFGAEVARSIEAPYALGDRQQLRDLLREAGAADAAIETVPGKARFDSLDAWVYTDIKGWTLADVIDDEGYARLKTAAPAKLSQFVLPDGSVEFAAPALIAVVEV